MTTNDQKQNPENPDSNGSDLVRLLQEIPEVNENIKTDSERNLLKTLNHLKEVTEIDLDGIPRLVDAFRNAYWDSFPPDPYYLSPTYYAVTGRRGLWKYVDKDAAFFFCLHPNKEDSLVIFPPMGRKTRQALSNFIKKLKGTGMTIEIARVNDSNRKLAETSGSNGKAFHLEKVDEQTLDWIFPVRTVSTEGLKTREGKEYSDVRQHTNRYYTGEFAKAVGVRPIDFSKTDDFAEAMALAKMWEMTTKHYEKYTVPTGYFKYMMMLASKGAVDLKGLIAFVNNKDVAFSIWEPPATKNETANLFASQLCIHDPEDPTTKHILKYLVVESAVHALEEDGAKYMCLGGSETEGMDQFKRIFNPIEDRSPALDTYRVVFEDQEKGSKNGKPPNGNESHRVTTPANDTGSHMALVMPGA